MKILMVNVCCGTGSTGRICTDLAGSLENGGHKVKIAYGRDKVPKDFQKYAVRIGTDTDVKLHGLQARLFDACGFGSKRATEKFVEWVKEYDPDVIHLHNIHGYYMNIQVFFDYLRDCRKKIIWTLHDCWAFTGHSAYCDDVNCKKWREGCYKCPQKVKYPSSFIDRSSRNWRIKKALFSGIPNLTIVTPSKWLAKLVSVSFLKDYDIKVIHNGIDTMNFKPLPNDFREFYGLEGKKILLGVSSSWDDMKGLADFIELAKLISDNYRIVLVGMTKKQINNLPSNIVGLEKTSSVKELAYIYSAADILLVLSAVENYPTVNLEAMACGTPVISYDVGGSAESIINNDGIVVPKGDIVAVVNAIEKIQGKITVNIDEIDIERFNNQYLDIYNLGGGIFR